MSVCHKYHLVVKQCTTLVKLKLHMENITSPMTSNDYICIYTYGWPHISFKMQISIYGRWINPMVTNILEAVDMGPMFSIFNFYFREKKQILVMLLYCPSLSLNLKH